MGFAEELHNLIQKHREKEDVVEMLACLERELDKLVKEETKGG